MKMFPFQSWFAERKRSIRCGRPFSGSAPLQAWYIQTGFRYRKMCTACNCAVQLRNWGTLPPGQSHPAKAPRRKHTARPNVAPASRGSGGRRSQTSSAVAAHCGLLRRSPCSPAVCTSCPLQNLVIEFRDVLRIPTFFILGPLRAKRQRVCLDSVRIRFHDCTEHACPPGCNKGYFISISRAQG